MALTAEERQRVAADIAELTARLDQVTSGFQRRLDALAEQVSRPAAPAREQQVVREQAVQQDTDLVAGVQ